MQQEEYSKQGIRYVRINKRKARIKFNEGKTIYLIPDMMRLEDAWKLSCPMWNEKNSTFDNRVDGFKYHNGLYNRVCGVKYFIAENDLK